MSQDLLKSVNLLLAKLGSTVVLREPPRLSKESPLFAGRIVLLDDSMAVMEAFVPRIAAFCEGRLDALLHTKERVEDLTATIFSHRPNLVLIDRYLGGNLRGETLVPLLKVANPRLICIGFSSESAAERLFVRAGADGFVSKEMDDVAGTFVNLADLITAISPPELLTT